MAESYRVEKWAERGAPNGAMLRMRMEAGGYSVSQWSDMPGAFYGVHMHAEAQSHWVVSGTLEIVVKSRSYVLKAGDRDFLPAETYYTKKVIGEGPVVYLVGELLPVKKKRGRPKKQAAPEENELPQEMRDLLGKFGIRG